MYLNYIPMLVKCQVWWQNRPKIATKKTPMFFPSMFVIVSVFCDFFVYVFSFFAVLVVQDLLHQSNLKLAR